MALTLTSKEMRKLLTNKEETRQRYIYMRKKAKERLSRLQRGGMSFYVDSIPAMPPARGQTANEIEANIKELNQFLKDPFTKISYVEKFEKNMVEIMTKQGYKEINAGNIREYNYFMSKIKKQYQDIYPVEVHDVFIQTNRLKIPVDLAVKHRDYLIKHLEALENITPGEDGKMNMKQLYNKVNYYERKVGYR